MTKVFIPNRGAHDFTSAERWGTLHFMSEGPLNRYATTQMHRLFTEALADSESGDYILPTSLGVMNMIAAAIFAHRHGRLNLLLYKDGGYVERKVVL